MTEPIILLPTLHRGDKFRKLRLRADSPLPVVCGAWRTLPDGRRESTYTADELARAFALCGLRLTAAEIAKELFT